jgi:hypothetical protein
VLGFGVGGAVHLAGPFDQTPGSPAAVRPTLVLHIGLRKFIFSGGVFHKGRPPSLYFPSE